MISASEISRSAPTHAEDTRQHAVRWAWGLFERKARWSLSWRGRLLALLLITGFGSAAFLSIHPFLAVTNRIDADVLVVEGWVHEYAIQAAIDEFRSRSYERVFTTGGPVEGSGGYINDFYTSASVGAELLRNHGLATSVVQEVPSRVMDRDRTYASAVALRNWFREHDIRVRRLNVLTEDVHARRSQLLFSKALGSEISVGVIAVPNPDYDARRWWRSSEGVKGVFSESLGYFYARFLFHSSKDLGTNKAVLDDH